MTRSPAHRDAVLVTAARSSRRRLIEDRQRRYLVTMSLRSLSFVAAIVVYGLGQPWAAAGILVISLVAPLVAVVAANNHARPDEGSAEFYAGGPQEAPRLERDTGVIDA